MNGIALGILRFNTSSFEMPVKF